MEYERVRESIDGILSDLSSQSHLLSGKAFWRNHRDLVSKALNRILSLVEIKSDDQSLPEIHWTSTKPMYARYPQELMLKPDAEGKHWVRVIPKPKRK